MLYRIQKPDVNYLEVVMWQVRAARERWTEKAAMWVAWQLPRRLVRCCYVRIGAHATTGKYSDTLVPELSMMDALQRWDR